MVQRQIYIERQRSSNKYTLTNDEIEPPKNGFDYSMSFWLYIQDYYENFAHWKHILHKGTEPDNLELTYEKWDNLTSDLREQSPGIWISSIT